MLSLQLRDVDIELHLLLAWLYWSIVVHSLIPKMKRR